MTNIVKRRASAYPKIFLCPSSALPVEGPRIEPRNEPAEIGTAAHLCVERRLKGDDVDVGAIAELYNVDVDELQGLYDSALPYLADIDMDRMQSEMPMEHEGRTGTADLVAILDNSIEITDWKFGYVSREYYYQMACYAWMAYGMFEPVMPDGFLVVCRVINPRIHYRQSYTFAVDDLVRWDKMARDKESKAGGVYSPGDHCIMCDHQYNCPQRDQWMQSGCAAIAEYSSGDVMGPAIIGGLYERYQAAKRGVAAFGSILRAAVEEGPVPLPNGKHLELYASKRDVIFPREAWAVLKNAGLTDDDLASIISIGKTKLLKTYKGKQAKGKGAAAVRELFSDLQNAGALGAKKTYTIKEVDDEGTT